MATQEDAICLLFLHEIREQANEAGKILSRKGVKCLGEKPCLDAFVNEWTIAQLAWVEHLAKGMTNQILHQAVKRMILEAVNTYDGSGETRFVDYELFILSPGDEAENYPKTPGSLFLLGFGERQENIPAKSIFSSRKKLTPDEQIMLMTAVNQSCWTPGFDLNSTLEALRPKAIAEIVSIA